MEPHIFVNSEMRPGLCARCQQDLGYPAHYLGSHRETLKAQISTPPDFWDKVEKPAHYCKHKTTTAQLVVDWELDFYLGNAVKYIERHQLKGDPEGDLRKAKKYLEMKIELLEKGRLESSISHG